MGRGHQNLSPKKRIEIEWERGWDWENRRRIYTEEKAKVVAAAWGTELLQFLVARSFLNLDNLKIRNGNENILIFLVFISPIFT